MLGHCMYVRTTTEGKRTHRDRSKSRSLLPPSLLPRLLLLPSTPPTATAARLRHCCCRRLRRAHRPRIFGSPSNDEVRRRPHARPDLAAEDCGKVFRAAHQDSKEDAENGTSGAGRRQQLSLRDAHIPHATEDHQCCHHGAQRQHRGAATREDVPVEEMVMVETEVERRPREVLFEDELVLVRILV